jgi:filamentous hemagglutinin family protein
MQFRLFPLSLGCGLALAFVTPVLSQIMPNGVGTLVDSQGNQINITGGTQTGANLFHSFQNFNLTSSQIANFLSNPQTRNILARINGGNPSAIDGLLQVSGGNSNLFLMNPSGIIFGANARLNVPASFTATTANSIGFGNNNLFNALGDNNFSALTGSPDSFIFTTNQAGSIVNAGNLTVGNGQNLSLIAGNTINTGRLTAPGGEIQVLAIPGTDRVRLSQPGQVLSLEFVPPINSELRAVDLPALLTGSGDLPGIQLNQTGQVQIAGTTLPTQQGVAVASGRIDVSSPTGNGGVVQVLGDRVAVLNSRINANGATGGGTVRVGGEYLGGRDTGITPALRFNSQRTLVDRNSLIRANATVTGEGGRVIVWADQNTGYFGRITGRGATGRGGFVEISGKENLAFDGRVEIPGANGLFGSLLLDPTNITIVAGGNNSQADDAQVNVDGTILSGDTPTNMTISAGALGAIPAGTTINITASGNIAFDTSISFGLGGTADVFFTASTITSSGSFNLNTNGRNLTIVANDINAPNLNIRSFIGSFSGNIQITANTGNLILGPVRSGTIAGNAGSINITASQGNITVNGEVNASSNNGNGGSASLNAPNGNITIGGISSQGIGAFNSSGIINISAGNFFRAVGLVVFCSSASICSSGFSGASDAAITISHGGGTTTPFVINQGIPTSTSGTFREIQAGAGSTIVLATIPAVLGTYTQGIIQIIANLPPLPPPVIPPVIPPTSPPTSPPVIIPFLGSLEPPPTPAPVIVGTPPTPDPIPDPTPISTPSLSPSPLPIPSPNPSPNPLPSPIPSSLPSPIPTITPAPSPLAIPSPPPTVLESIPTTVGDVSINPQSPREISAPFSGTLTLIGTLTNAETSAKIGSLENSLQSDFQQYLGLTPRSTAPRDFQGTQLLLNQITEKTGTKPALVYVFFAPPDGSNDFDITNLAAQTNRTAKDTDQLEAILVTGTGRSLRIQLSGATRRQILEVARNFRSDVTNFRSSRGYLTSAQQMYQWILAPLEEELQKQGINNLVFLMDSGLRTIPLAAMHDGQGFIIERYSVGLMPSLNLTEPGYYSLQGSQVLAMGATDFSNSGLNPLPAVSLELSTISQLWNGAEFLNERFTLDNLTQQRQNNPFRIIHLATHGYFNSGDRSNSYIQFWDQRLSLDKLSQLNLGNPPVDLLVLSACQTALGDKDAELGFAGLAINAGVRSALASLWEVNDAATLGLMTKFYQQLQVTTTKAEALRQAQLSMLRGEVRLEGGNLVTPNGTIPLTEELRQMGNLSLTHPYYWSAFTIVGNPW